MKKLSLIFFVSMFIGQVAHSNELLDRIKTFNWDGLEVVWLQDERFPTYDVVFYFADGALSDDPGRMGETSAMFNLLTAGTRRFSQRAISDNLEFYGVSHSSDVTHEYSVYTVGGLAKDIVPTFKQICHLFRDATFPKNELKREIRRAVDSFKNMVTSHSSLASRAFREISLKGSPFSYPSSGKMKDIKRLSQKRLKSKLEYFNNNVKKKIYIAGPRKALVIKNIINEECGWKGLKDGVVRTTNYQTEQKKTPKIFLVTVPKANQAQVRIGRLLKKQELTNPTLMGFTASYLGGGFTSKLMRAVRVKGGLTYSIGAFAAPQKDYGRSVISTFSTVEKVKKLISTIKETINEVQENKFPDEELERARGYLVGSYPFAFEKSSALLSQLISLDHRGRDYSEILDFTKKVKSYDRSQVSLSAKDIFKWDEQTIVVLGPKSLEKELKEIGEVKVVKYNDFL